MIFNSITTFAEQVGRRRTHKQKSTELDTMSCVFVGPQAIVADFIPADGTPHHEYTFMRSTGWEVTDKVATQCELHIDYIGKFAQGPPLISHSYHEGAISWTSFASQIDKVLVPAWSTPAVVFQGNTIVGPFRQSQVTSTAYLNLTYNCRFTGDITTRSWLTMNPPIPSTPAPYRSNNNLVSSPANPAGVRNLTIYITGASKANDKFGLVTAQLTFNNEVNTTITDMGNGWYEVVEVTTVKPFIATTVNVQT
jgi:hypothetical protein